MEVPLRTIAPCSSSKSSNSTKIPVSEASRCENGGPLEECDGEISSPVILPHSTDGVDRGTTAEDSNLTACIDRSQENRPSRSLRKARLVIRKIRSFPRPCFPSPSSSSSSSSQHQQQRRVGLSLRRRKPTALRLPCGENDMQVLALPLGMSIAAVVAQILDQKEAGQDRLPADHLSMICTSAVKESVASVFGDRFDGFMRNFEKSFESTLKTLRLLNQASPCERGDSSFTRDVTDSSLKDLPDPNTRTQLLDAAEAHEDAVPNSENSQLILNDVMNQQLANLLPNATGSGCSQSILTTFEKSVMEQARMNDLKTYEIALTMQGLRLKESELALSSDANSLERCKLSMGISKASFKAEKFKTQLEDTQQAELLRKCIDCLVAGLLIMSAFLIYGAYIYSYRRIVEATDACTLQPKESTSWWVPKSVSSVSSGFQLLKCQAIVLSRMLFGLLIILALAYSLLQRSSTSRQNMPVTIILLLLGVGCGFFGKLCVDTLGGSGYCWLLHWEVLCLLHFFANVFTPSLFFILHGPVSMSEGTKKVWLPYWIRRVTFYSAMLLFVPMLCGLMPFASLRDWKEHFSSAVVGNLLEPVFKERD